MIQVGLTMKPLKPNIVFYPNLTEEILIEMVCALNGYRDTEIIISPLKKPTKLKAMQNKINRWYLIICSWLNEQTIHPSTRQYIQIIPGAASIRIHIESINEKPYATQ